MDLKFLLMLIVKHNKMVLLGLFIVLKYYTHQLSSTFIYNNLRLFEIEVLMASAISSDRFIKTGLAIA
jgi:hypothetical protein